MRSSLVLLLCCSCGFVVTGDDELADEFARFKAAGGDCAAPGVDGPDGASPLPPAYAAPVFDTLYRLVLGDVVAPSGRVRYPILADDARRRGALDLAVAQLGVVDLAALSGDDAIAFWVNAYNVIVLAGAAAGFAADPAFRVDQDAFSFFDRRVHDVGGRLFSLNEIEHGVLRGVRTHASTGSLPDDDWEALRALHVDAFGDAPIDARIHFVLNCASTSCPPLAPGPYVGATLDDALDAQTRAFLLDEDKGAGPGGISEIFAFYQEDFDAEGGAQAFIERYRTTSDVDLGRFLAYDWSLNLATD